MQVKHNLSEQVFTVTLDGHEGELTYARPQSDLIDFQHTWVDEALRGRGVADALARAGLEFARAEGLRVKLTCTFMRAYAQRHPEWQDLLAS